eukprot:1455543-Pyramimonas_sp.AAC.1
MFLHALLYRKAVSPWGVICAAGTAGQPIPSRALPPLLLDAPPLPPSRSAERRTPRMPSRAV